MTKGAVDMEYRHLGRSGLRVSCLGLGSWVTYGQQVGDDLAYACMSAAYDAGVRFFDSAESYAAGEAERVVGRVIKRAGWQRSDLVISTKIFWGGEGPNDRGLSRKHVIEGTDAALRRLQLDYVDLVYCHRPDPSTPLEETVWAMNHLIAQGKAFYWGTSEWSAELITEAIAIARRDRLVPPTVEQPKYNMFHRDRVEREYARLCERAGLGVTTYSPLASGVLTGKYNGGIPPGTRTGLAGMEWLRDELTSDAGRAQVRKVRALEEVAAELRCTVAQLALAWCLRNPQVSSVITGASRVEQVWENLGALAVVERLAPETLQRIEAILENAPSADAAWRSFVPSPQPLRRA